MKLWLGMLLMLPLLAQEAAQTKEATKTEESSSPQAEKTLEGYVDLGARWIGYGGDFNTYRSLVNLSQGLRLVGTDVKWEPAKSRWIDSLRIQGANWGGDPYNTARLDLYKKGIYRYVGTYSNIAYFNYLPSFADPTAAGGVYLNQRSYDTTVRTFDNELQLFPGGRVIPYLSYGRNSDLGTGITTLVETGNEYPLRNLLNWKLDEYRAGARIELKHFHATVEAGGMEFKDDQGVYSTGKLTGNRLSQYLGQSLFLQTGQQFYRVRGNGYHEKALFSASPASWLDLSGQIVRFTPKTLASYSQNATGNLVSEEELLLLFPRTTDMFFGTATMPRTSGSISAEARPMNRLRIRTSYETDRFVSSGQGTNTAAFYATLAGLTAAQTVTASEAERLEVSRNREQIEALYDLSKRVLIRGGYRYEFGTAVVKANPYTTDQPTETAKLQRHIGLAGFRAVPVTRWVATGDVEYANGVKTYYRTGLMDTKKWKLQNRVSIAKSWFFNLNYAAFLNSNPSTGINNQFTSYVGTASLQWMPDGGKNVSILADYQRSAVHSEIITLYPLGLFELTSKYRDNAHTGTLMADMKLPMTHGYAGRMTFGGSFVSANGSRPVNYYMPQGRIQLPVTPRLQFFSEWKYYGLNQSFYTYEGFRSHSFTGGIRIQL